MARSFVESKLTAFCSRRFQFAVASHADDSDIRRLLRETPLAGAISVSFEREPDYFADRINPFESKQTIVARDGDLLVCMGSCSVRSRFINGKEARIGYLGGLRLASNHAGHTEILRAGYEFFHELEVESPADFYFTSIASDNHRARRILERGIPGMPVYQFVGELVTLMIPTRHTFNPPPKRDAARTSLPDVSSRLNDFNRGYQLAPVWSADELDALSSLGLLPQHFVQCGEASAALWDQSAFKQMVIRGYAPRLKRFRPLANALTALIGGIRLPVVGQQIRNAHVSHLVADSKKNDLIELLNRLRSIAGVAGVDFLTLAFAEDDVRLAMVRRNFRTREYRSRLYSVCWPDCGNSIRDWNHRLMAPEAALL
jgi:hypothetical protein